MYIYIFTQAIVVVKINLLFTAPNCKYFVTTFDFLYYCQKKDNCGVRQIRYLSGNSYDI